MTSSGWHPDPRGRADRRYHDGTRWTEHVAAADGTTSTDPDGAEPAPAPQIGPPPPRPRAAEPSPEPVIRSAGNPPDPIGGTADRTQRLTPEDIAAARSGAIPLAKPIEADNTTIMTADDVAAAAALASAGPPPDATSGHHTAPMSPEDIAAAAALAAARDRDAGPLPSAGPGRPAARRSDLGMIGAVLGIVVGAASLFALPWTSAPGADPSWWDLRDAVDTAALDIGALGSAFVLTGVAFGLVAGGIAAFARAHGARALRGIAAAVVVLAAGGLAVAGYAAIDVEVSSVPATADGLGPQAGAPVTLPDGTPVTDPTTGEPVTVGEDDAGTEGLTEDQVVAATTALGEERLTDAAAVGAVVLAGAALFLLVGLAVRGTVGHVLTAVGQVVIVGAGIGTVLQLGASDLADAGTGLYLAIAGAVILTVASALPGRAPTVDLT